MNLNERITITPGMRSGKPCIRGMRMTVVDVLEYLAGGMTFEEVLKDFPYLEREDILACIDFAATQLKAQAQVPDPAIDEAWGPELDRRVAEIESGKVVGIPFDQVTKEMRKRVGL